jgi:hypothetical protein
MCNILITVARGYLQYGSGFILGMVIYQCHNQCWEVLLFWNLKPMGKGRVMCVLLNGSSKKSKNRF